MQDERESYPVSESASAERDPPRTEETGETAEPDAPASVEENDSMGTILDADPTLGVQADE